MSDRFQEVERPHNVRPRPRGILAPELAAILATVETGKAILITLDGRKRTNVQGNILAAAQRRGMNVRTRSQEGDKPGTVLFWLEAKG